MNESSPNEEYEVVINATYDVDIVQGIKLSYEQLFRTSTQLV